ncbi:MAG: hypothetical protein ACI9DH_000555 [Halioglobus sp.]|jgi:hypothetical protein
MAILKGVKNKIDVKVTAKLDSDNGRTEQVTFIVTYKKPNVEEQRELQARINPDINDNGDPVVDPITDQEIVDEYVLGWKEVPTETGEPFDFTPENVDAMMSAREYRAAIIEGLLTAVFGKGALAKNSSNRGGLGR